MVYTFIYQYINVETSLAHSGCNLLAAFAYAGIRKTKFGQFIQAHLKCLYNTLGDISSVDILLRHMVETFLVLI